MAFTFLCSFIPGWTSTYVLFPFSHFFFFFFFFGIILSSAACRPTRQSAEMYLLPGDIAYSHLFMISLGRQLRDSDASPRSGRSYWMAQTASEGKNKCDVLTSKMKAMAAAPAFALVLGRF